MCQYFVMSLCFCEWDENSLDIRQEDGWKLDIKDEVSGYVGKLIFALRMFFFEQEVGIYIAKVDIEGKTLIMYIYNLCLFVSL